MTDRHYYAVMDLMSALIRTMTEVAKECHKADAVGTIMIRMIVPISGLAKEAQDRLDKKDPSGHTLRAKRMEEVCFNEFSEAVANMGDLTDEKMTREDQVMLADKVLDVYDEFSGRDMDKLDSSLAFLLNECLVFRPAVLRGEPNAGKNRHVMALLRRLMKNVKSFTVQHMNLKSYFDSARRHRSYGANKRNRKRLADTVMTL